MHALLSPSGASRWLACTPSARLEETFPQSSNTAADEGTLAHALAELLLRNNLKQIKSVLFEKELKKIKNHKLYNAEMNGHAMDYASFIMEKYEALKDATIIVEDQIDLTEFVPEGFGTLDCAIIADYILDINDLKYGKGVLVEAHENKQMMLYALGALQKYSLSYHIDKVRMTIFQPRLDNHSSFEVDAAWLLEWGENEVKQKAALAHQGKGDYVPGSHCQFCKARNECKALADHNMQLASYAFEDPNKLSPEDIANILDKGPDMVKWFSGIKTYALQQAVSHDMKWPGFKLVQGRSNRKYADPAAIIKTLQKAKISNDLFLTEPELVGIGALEKNIGKAVVEKLCSAHIIKPPGAATLVPEWDKRPEINSTDAAKIAFEDVDLGSEAD